MVVKWSTDDRTMAVDCDAYAKPIPLCSVVGGQAGNSIPTGGVLLLEYVGRSRLRSTSMCGQWCTDDRRFAPHIGAPTKARCHFAGIEFCVQLPVASRPA